MPVRAAPESRFPEAGEEAEEKAEKKEICVRDTVSRTGAVRTLGSEGVRVAELIDAAWVALVAGRPKELQVLETLLERPLELPLSDGPGAAGVRDSLRRLEMLLAATARNLRVLRRQAGRG